MNEAHMQQKLQRKYIQAKHYALMNFYKQLVNNNKDIGYFLNKNLAWVI